MRRCANQQQQHHTCSKWHLQEVPSWQILCQHSARHRGVAWTQKTARQARDGTKPARTYPGIQNAPGRRPPTLRGRVRTVADRWRVAHEIFNATRDAATPRETCPRPRRRRRSVPSLLLRRRPAHTRPKPSSAIRGSGRAGGTGASWRGSTRALGRGRPARRFPK